MQVKTLSDNKSPLSISQDTTKINKDGSTRSGASFKNENPTKIKEKN